MFCITVLCFIFVNSLANGEIKNYSGYKTYRIIPDSEEQLKVLEELSENGSYDFWSNVKLLKHKSDVMVEPSEQRNFELLMKKKNLNYSVLIDDVEKVLEEERGNMDSFKSDDVTRFNKYLRYSEIVEYLKDLSKKFPQLLKVKSIGRTYEGREQIIAEISKNRNNSETSRPGIFIDAGIHAREWAAPALALYIITQLVEEYDENSGLVDNMDWYIVPVANPDGYEYSHTHDRMWRKTRSKNFFCTGTDPNRNFGFHWGEAGASRFPCLQTYRGSTQFSEAETRNIRDFLLSHRKQLRAYVAVHSYGPYWLYPWGFDDQLPADWKDLDEVARSGAEAIRRVSGAEYVVGSTTKVLYAASGASDDYAKGVVGIKYAYTLELVGGGRLGFDLPGNRLLNVVSEAFEGIRVLAYKVAEK